MLNDSGMYNETIFESVKHINDNGQEYWYARELQTVLEYTQWRRFKETISRAIQACENSGNQVLDHFAEVGKLIKTGKGAQRKKLNEQN